MVGEQRKIVVGLLFGGRSAEHDVSRVSAANILRALNPDQYEVSLIGISKDGRWLVCDAGNGAGTGATALTIPDKAPQIGLIPGGRGRFVFCDSDRPQGSDATRIRQNTSTPKAPPYIFLQKFPRSRPIVFKSWPLRCFGCSAAKVWQESTSLSKTTKYL
jgi:hypothetical protein